MNKSKNVSHVILRGHLIVTLPVFVIMLSFPFFLGIFMSFFIEWQNVTMFIVLGFIVSPLIAWGWWSLTIANWRVWAFENVNKENWEKLMRRAIRTKLIWPQYHRYEKTEIRTKSQEEFIEKVYRYLEEKATSNNTV